MTRKLYLFLFICSLSLTVNARQILTKTANDSTVMSVDIEDGVVIYAFKSNANLAVRPTSATVLKGDRIKEQQIQSIKELSALIPNFFMPEYGSRLTSPVYIRGIGSRINAPSVGLYVDGIPYFDRSSFDFDMSNIDRIEVLRGPQGTLYGRNTMGGIINVYTKSPFRYRETNATLSAGNYNTYKAGFSHIGNINNKFGYAASVNYRHQGGYLDNIYTRKKADGMDMFSGRVRLGWDINARLLAYITTAYEYSDQDGYAYGIFDPETKLPGKVNYNAPSYYRRNMSNNGLTVEYTAPAFKISSNTSFQFLDGRQGIDQDFTPDDQYYVIFTHRHRMYAQEANIKSTTANRYQWLFGVFGFYQDYAQTNNVDYRQLDRQSDVAVENPTMGYALYHQSEWNDLLIEGLSATAGIRFDWEKNRMKNHTRTHTPAGTAESDFSARDIYTQVTPKFTLNYNFGNNRIVYASVSKGYKAGGFNTTVEREEDRVYEPEHSWSYEIGTKGNYFDHQLTTAVSLFYIDWTNQQISQKRASEQGFKMRNAGESFSRGVEVSAHLFPLRRFNVLLNYGYTYAKFEKYLYDESNDLDYGGNYLPLVPRNTVSANVNYSIPLKERYWIDHIRLSGQYAGLGKLYWNDNNSALQSFYQTVNAQVALIQKNYSIEFWARNITNEKYVTYYFESMGNQFAQQGKPFSFGVDFNLKF